MNCKNKNNQEEAKQVQSENIIGHRTNGPWPYRMQYTKSHLILVIESNLNGIVL